MKKFLSVLGVLLIAGAVAWAQQTNPNAINGGVYNVTPPALSDKQPSTFQMDSAGNVKVNSASGGGATSANQLTEITALNTLISQAISSCALSFCGLITNPQGAFTRPSNTTPYSQNDLIASNVTNTSVVVPSFLIANSAGGVAIPRVRLYSNVTASWDAAAVTVRLWSSPPTYANGDNGAYSVSTGAANFLGRFDVTFTQVTDGTYGVGAPSVGTSAYIKVASGMSVYWDLQYTGSTALTPASAQTFTLQPELVN